MKNKKKIEPIQEPIRNKYDICAQRGCIYYTFNLDKTLKTTGCTIGINPQVCRKFLKIKDLLDKV